MAMTRHSLISGTDPESVVIVQFLEKGLAKDSMESGCFFSLRRFVVHHRAFLLACVYRAWALSVCQFTWSLVK